MISLKSISLKSVLPRGLFGRAALILLVPIVALQIVVSAAFLQRHFEGVTRQMTRGITREVDYVLDGAAVSLAEAGRRAEVLGLRATQGKAADLAASESRVFYDLSGKTIIARLREDVRFPIGLIDLVSVDKIVRVVADTGSGPVEIRIDRARMSASNPHQLLVLMIFVGFLMTIIAFVFLRNQLRPITLLAEAASAFGKGRHEPYRPRGALEVRAAGAAFLDMRARIERQIEQRTLMLSGVSHDLRTPLTRLRLGLAMQPDNDETRALLSDVADMERLVNEFLAFVRGDAMESEEPVDPATVIDKVIEAQARTGRHVTKGSIAPTGPIRLRPQAIARALENLVSNALRYGSLAEISLTQGDRIIRFAVDDNGPGIPKDRRDEALRPFVRLSSERDPNKGGGVGLGLAIAADIARSHGGALRLSDSVLGGLRAELEIAR